MDLALHEGRLVHDAAMRANAAIFPNPRLKPLAGFGFVLENRV